MVSYKENHALFHIKRELGGIIIYKKMTMKYKIASFWSRIGAFGIDTIILGIFGMILGSFFCDYFAIIGSSGLLIGFVISLFYFSILSSKIGNGQTLGKRLLKLKVIDINEKQLALHQAFLRTLVLTVPYFFINYTFPGIAEDSIFYLVKVQLFYYTLIGLVVIYIFNKFTRQSIHDLTVNSFVVEQTEFAGGSQFMPIKSYVFYIWGGIISIFIAITILSFTKPKQNLLGDDKSIHEELLKIEGVLNAGTNRNTTTFYGKDENNVTESFSASLHIKNLPNDFTEFESSEIVKRAVKIILEKYPEVENIDLINIQLVRGYNIGIARSNRSIRDSKTPLEWLELYEMKNSKLVEKIELYETSKSEETNNTYYPISKLQVHKIT